MAVERSVAVGLGHYSSAGGLARRANEAPAHLASVAVDKRRVSDVYDQTFPPGGQLSYEPRSLMPVTIGVDSHKGSHTACTRGEPRPYMRELLPCGMLLRKKGGRVEELSGKVAVVTGGASGMGVGLAKRFCSEGMAVAVADVDEAGLGEAAEDRRGTGASVVEVPTDVSDAQQVEGMAVRVMEHFGAVHVVCNNAGVGASGTVWELPVEDWDWVLRVNLFGVLHGIRSFVRRLLAGGEGQVVNTASFSGLVNLFLSPPYSASKAAVVALSESLHFQLRALGAPVGVSVLCPNWVRTRIVESDRNRPRHLPRAPSSPRTEGARSALREVVASGMGPGEVADHVVRAIRANRFYVLPHHDEGHLALVRQRTADVIEEGSPALPTIPGIGPVLAALAGPAGTC